MTVLLTGAYAESDDGLTWRKTELGLVEYNGGRGNNLDLTPFLQNLTHTSRELLLAVSRNVLGPAASALCYALPAIQVGSRFIPPGWKVFLTRDGLQWLIKDCLNQGRHGGERSAHQEVERLVTIGD